MAGLPIHDFADDVSLLLGEVLWSWEYCDGCKSKQLCNMVSCPPRKISRAKRYFRYYEALVLDYHEGMPHDVHVLSTHGDIFAAISRLRADPDTTRAGLAGLIASRIPSPARPGDLANAITLIVKIVTMTDCSTLYESPDRLEKGTSKPCWGDDVPFREYLQDLFKTQDHPIWSSRHGGNELVLSRISELKATKLKKHLKLGLRPTHDIRNHLRLDLRRNELEVFHYASFIKQQLRATRGAHMPLSTMGFVPVDVLPRQLLLETLDSMQRILFPLHDAKSKLLLSSLVDSPDYAFDPETLKLEFGSICTPEEENVSYVYLADRLEELYQETKTPRPRTWLDKQLQRRSGARYSEYSQKCSVPGHTSCFM
ncbi:Uu.00g029080.m01.CDS01 [Anthostomella pinea]|uniref:Uu.00g029080.m01.CDS01 n=1 Tax=Anthostomella pinea TaxID=933095 RepID=A0AAI8YCT9_9PEZI|nr:Uu.00g029080.m01.CDS01 [Anthostomella pinea]